MNAFRALLLRHGAMALAMVLMALCMKALVPAGFMVRSDSAMISVQICTQSIAGQTVRQMAVPMKHGSGESGGTTAKGDCPFASAPAVSLAGADVTLLALALVFILALGFAPTRPALLRRALYLRPPLRGPPAGLLTA